MDLFKSKNEALAELLMQDGPEFIKRPLSVLSENKKEMEQTNRIGADNYYHRKAMCENAQNGYVDAFTSLLLGIGKEGIDFYNKDKSINGNGKMSATEALTDGYKDMKNNIEGLLLGLKNPNIDCKILLENLDWGTNKWRKPQR